MKRIGIITIPDYNNYGNRLQNYAVKCYFEEHGFLVNTLELNDELFDKKKERKYKLLLKKFHLFFVLYAFEVLKGGVSKARRYMCFEKFTQKYLAVKYSPNWDASINKKIAEGYDYIVLGSDQIWHPYVNSTPTLFFGLFAPAEKRLFFAPSFGVDSISDEYSEIVRNGLKDVDKISVRESSGRKILNRLVDAKVDVLCDPTLTIGKTKWENIAKRPVDIPDEFILTYFLGPINDQYNDLIAKVKKIAGKERYCLADKNIESAYSTGPSEFIYSIMNSQFVVTDSFHAVVFSIIFSKPFIVCSRLKEDGTHAGLDSRIDTLLKMFDLEDRKYVGDNSISKIMGEQIDKSDVLHTLRDMVDSYFEESFI